MIESVKKYLGGAYAAVVAILFAVIYFLFTKEKNTSNQLNQIKAEKDLAQALSDKDKQEKEADNAEKDYAAARAEFIRKHGSDGSTDE